jgi:gluconate 2-dehydrogenase alpha chain
VGTVIDDFNGDNFDHSGLGFLGGAGISVGNTGARPISYRPTPPGTPRWGSAWKAAVARYYNRASGVGGQGYSLPYRQNYLDLDPNYRDAYGLPLLRMTFDWKDNERRLGAYISDVCERIGKAMGASQVINRPDRDRYSIVPYQSTHNCGGAIMGARPETSAVNRYLQSWDVTNLFVVGASAFAHNSGYNPTGTVGALAYWTADAITNRYVKRPGPLA